MAEMKDFSIPGVGYGILHPVLANRFCVNFHRRNGVILSAQVERCLMNFVERTIEIHVQQPVADNGLLSEVCDMMNEMNRPQISVDLLDGNETIIRRIVFAGLKPADHNFDLDYAVSDIATHVMVFSFESVDALQVVQEEQPEK